MENYTNRNPSVKTNNNGTLKDKQFFRYASFVGFIYLFILFLVRLQINHFDEVAIVYLSISIGYGLLSLFSPNKILKTVNDTWLFYIFSFVSLNIGFLFSGGFLSPIIHPIFPFILFVIYFEHFKTTSYIILLLFLNLLTLFIYNYYKPTILFNENDFIILIERSFSHIFTLIISMLIINIIFKKYESDKTNAQLSENSKEAFLSNMSHLIRTPLNGINGYTSLLQDNEIPDFEKEIFKKRILTNAKELHHMIFNLIDLSIIQEKSLKLKNEPFFIEDLIETLKNKITEEATDQSKIIELKIKNQVPNSEQLNLDGDRVFQMIWNFIENSIEHMVQGIIYINFKVINDGSLLNIDIEDNGSGIDSKLLNSIVNKNILERNQSTIANPKPGMGILISRGIINYMGGHFFIDSEKNKGTYVHIEIPLNKTNAQME